MESKDRDEVTTVLGRLQLQGVRGRNHIISQLPNGTKVEKGSVDVQGT